VGVQVWSRNQGPVISMEVSSIPGAQKSTTSSEQCDFSFHYRGVVKNKYAPLGETVNKEHYLKVLRHLPDTVRRKSPGLWDARNLQLHRDNAQFILHTWSRASWPSTAFRRFARLPTLMTRLLAISGCSRQKALISTAARAQLHTIPKRAFQKCFQRWKDRWAKCVESQGVYFEGDD
jgi:hypothetical protein